MWSARVVAVVMCVMIGGGLCAVNMHSADTDFTIKPDGKLGTATISVPREGLSDFGCTFTYQAFGGTNEVWSLSVFKADANHICVAQRNTPTYLMFSAFSLSITDGSITESGVESKSGAFKHNQDFTSAGQTLKAADGFQGTVQRVYAVSSV